MKSSNTCLVTLTFGASFLLVFDELDFLERANGFVTLEFSGGLPHLKPHEDADLSPFLAIFTRQFCHDFGVRSSTKIARQKSFRRCDSKSPSCDAALRDIVSASVDGPVVSNDLRFVTCLASCRM